MLKPLKWSVLLVLPLVPPVCSAYSVLTHEAIIDSAWDSFLRPLLLRRFPNAGAEELRAAHAFAYGGSMIQDMGYYPFGSRLFSALTHYVRSGDFVRALLDDSRDLNEYAFALGSLAHYAADNCGHPLAVNRAVPLLYPRLRAKYGDVITFEDNRTAHLKTEFGFDVEQVAHNHYAPTNYHDFIGFEVSKRVLEAAFQQTYGLRLAGLFTNLDLALGTYRHTVSSLLPEATKIAWKLKQDEIRREAPTITRARFLYNLSRADYRREWGSRYQRPGILARILAFLFRLLPTFGPFRGIDFKPPTPQTGQLFMASFNLTMARYRKQVEEAGTGALQLPNLDFDTGQPTREGEYRLADKAYAELLKKLAQQQFAGVTPEIRRNILSFYQNGDTPAKLLAALAQLKAR